MIDWNRRELVPFPQQKRQRVELAVGLVSFAACRVPELDALTCTTCPLPAVPLHTSEKLVAIKVAEFLSASMRDRLDALQICRVGPPSI